MTDWDDAFDNVGQVPGALAYFDVWPARAQVFRVSGVKAELELAYGVSAREKIDLFLPFFQPFGQLCSAFCSALFSLFSALFSLLFSFVQPFFQFVLSNSCPVI